MEKLIDRIYEAAVVPDVWPGVLDDLTKIGDGYATFLFSVVAGRMSWVGSQRSAYGHDYVREGWPARTDRAARLFGAKHAGFLGDLDVYTREEMDREPVFVEFLRPRGIGWGIATAIPVPTGEALVFDIERRIETGPVDRATVGQLDLLRPHLARAGLLSARMALERARAATVALDLIGLPAGIIGHNLRIFAANPRLEALMPTVVADRKARVALTHANADNLLGEALASLGLSSAIQGVRSIPIPARDNGPPLIVHLVPIRRDAQEVFVGAAAILVVTPVVPANVPGAEVLQGLFDLTAAEARVAHDIGQGQRIDAIAEGLGVSRETVRSQLKAVLAKTGAARQIDLSVLLSGASISSST